jgi:hypothetical protein
MAHVKRGMAHVRVDSHATIAFFESDERRFQPTEILKFIVFNK